MTLCQRNVKKVHIFDKYPMLSGAYISGTVHQTGTTISPKYGHNIMAMKRYMKYQAGCVAFTGFVPEVKEGVL